MLIVKVNALEFVVASLRTKLGFMLQLSAGSTLPPLYLFPYLPLAELLVNLIKLAWYDKIRVINHFLLSLLGFSL